jgi:hypothetical protein
VPSVGAGGVEASELAGADEVEGVEVGVKVSPWTEVWYKGSPWTEVELATIPHTPSVFAISPLVILKQ